MRDWYESYRSKLTRQVKEARNVHRQTLSRAGEELDPILGAPNNAEKADSLLSIQSMHFIADPLSILLSKFSLLALSAKAIKALSFLNALVEEVINCGSLPRQEDAEAYQPKLGALIAFTGGGVLRPGSVSGLFVGTHHVAPDISIFCLNYFF